MACEFSRAILSNQYSYTNCPSLSHLPHFVSSLLPSLTPLSSSLYITPPSHLLSFPLNYTVHKTKYWGKPGSELSHLLLKLRPEREESNRRQRSAGEERPQQQNRPRPPALPNCPLH